MLQPDGKIIIGGTFSAVRGTARANVQVARTDDVPKSLERELKQARYEESLAGGRHAEVNPDNKRKHLTGHHEASRDREWTGTGQAARDGTAGCKAAA
jgi:hypothetical protein